MTRKTLIHGLVLSALVIALSGCVYGPPPVYYGYDTYHGYPVGYGGYYPSPSIGFRFFYGSGWHGQHWFGGGWHRFRH